ncbi:MAG TPA: hypothetical protein VH593_26040 [Ktedonobacteraceae bacterium]|jgi:hypothetical protein
MDVQPGTSDGKERAVGKRVTRRGRTLHVDVMRLSAQLEAYAGSLVKRRCTRNDRLHWQTRGRQALLRQAATHLLNIATTYRTEYTLFLALKDYLGCLEKYQVDVNEEPRRSMMNKISPMMQWKREGAARELPTLGDHLTQFMKRYPFLVEHVLSFDGNEVMALYE